MLYSVITDEDGHFVSRIVEAPDEIAAKTKLAAWYEGNDHFRQHKPRIICAAPAEIIGKEEIDAEDLMGWFDLVDETIYACPHAYNNNTMLWHDGIMDFLKRKLS